MKTRLHKKSTAKTAQTAAAHTKNGFSLEDNRPSTIIQQKKNNTGLPDGLKSGIESLSGHSLDDVKVHYNSAKPAQLNAHAYAQGTNIHLASGQEKHLPHEAWHIVQQKQGRVRPTKTVNGAKINDNAGLEKEADVMGAKALQRKVDSRQITQKKIVKNTTASETSIQKMQHDVIQFAEPQDTLDVIQKYFPDTYNHYGADLIRKVCVENDMRVHAHGSGKPGDGINAATQKEMDNLIPYLRAAKESSKKEDKEESKEEDSSYGSSKSSKSKAKYQSKAEKKETDRRKEAHKEEVARRKKENYLAKKADGGSGGSSKSSKKKGK
ncbi:uncharacterized protein DUF4157 [Kordia periserrulae]|uniref:Uncharacterized protein DUF4157 n=1 Tax=Kordia periserrulae TaxID=701523 RepID=A0A2T6C6Z2_9FLAO|nr:DUF4157 domain-containing protein [Kordia periserrulae]PTX64067.1 uncharacterized protein DUF4157 [Kordia periserrulae]